MALTEVTVTITYPGLGLLDAEATDRLLAELLERVPQVGPVLAQDTKKDTLDVVFSFEAEVHHLLNPADIDLRDLGVGRVLEEIGGAMRAAGLAQRVPARAELVPALA